MNEQPCSQCGAPDARGTVTDEATGETGPYANVGACCTYAQRLKKENEELKADIVKMALLVLPVISDYIKKTNA